MARAMCGIVSPTKAIGPATAVAPPHSSVIESAPSARVRPTLAPSARPESSPSASALSGRASASAITPPSEQERADLGEDLHVAPDQ